MNIGRALDKRGNESASTEESEMSIFGKLAIGLALTAVTVVAPGVASAHTTAQAEPVSVQTNCGVPPAAPGGFHWAGNCWSGVQGSQAGASCQRTGNMGQSEGQWSDWRCLGELRSDNLFYYFLYVR
jgi:hypothetical protein